jgi:hypothetical protein
MPGPGFVQAKTGSGTTSPVTVTLTTATGSQPGPSCLVVAVGEGNSTTNPAVSGITLGGSGDHWSGPAAGILINADANCELWTDQNCASGQTSVAVSFTPGSGAGNGYCVAVFEFAGILSSGAVDQTNNAGAASGSWNSGSVTPGQLPEAVIGVGVGIGAGGAPTITGPSSPWNNQSSVSAARTTMIAGYQIVSSGGSVNYGGTVSTGRVGAAVITLKPSPSGNLLLLGFP